MIMVTNQQNPFHILNVTPESSPEEIKRAYKNFVKLYHPDTYQGNKDAATEKMKELNWAYEALSDDTLFIKYANEYIELENEKNSAQNQEPDYNECFYHTTYSNKRKTNEAPPKTEDGNPRDKGDEAYRDPQKVYLSRGKFIALVLATIVVFLLVFLSIHWLFKKEDSPDTHVTSSSNYSNSETVVYVTYSGKKYHRSSCSYLSSSKIEIELEDAVNDGYSRCSRCKPPKLN